MKHLKGVAKLNGKIEELQALAEEIAEAHSEKEEWLENKSEKYQESDAYQAWTDYLYNLRNTLDAIESLELIDEPES